MAYKGKISLTDEKWVLCIIFLLALILRAAAISCLPAEYKALKGEARHYDTIAVNSLNGKGYFTDAYGGAIRRSWKTPGYPLFLALIYSIFGHSYFAVRVIQCVMSALLCIFIFYIGKKTFNRQIGLISALILAFYQPYISNRIWGPGFLFSENLFNFLLAISVIFLIRNLFERLNLKNSMITGVFLGLLVLTRPVIALFPSFLIALLLYKNKHGVIFTLKNIAIFLAGFVLVILPWVARNYYVHKAFVPLCTEGGLALLGSNNPYARGGGLIDLKPLFKQEEWDKLKEMSEVEEDYALRRKAREFLFKNYKMLPRLFFRKLLVQWDVFRTDYDLDAAKRYNLFYAVVLMFGLVGIAKAIKSGLSKNALLLISLFLYTSIIAMIFSGDERLRYPVELYLVVFAGLGVFTIYNSFKNKFLSYIIICGIIGVNLLFYVYSDAVLNWTRELFSFIGL